MYDVIQENGAKVKFSNGLCGFTLKRDLTVEGDTTLSKSMDLNGYALTINGNLTQTSGEMTIKNNSSNQNGTLNVNGNYTLSGSSYLYMSRYSSSHNNPLVNITGNFTVSSNNGNTLSSGIISVGGNFYQKNGKATNSASVTKNFTPFGTSVKFTGTDKIHEINSESPNTSMHDIILTDGAELSFNGNFGGLDSVSSCNFSSEDTAVAKASGNIVKAVSAGNTKLKIENTSGSNTTVNLEVQGLVAGDSNFDGEINIADAVILQRYLLGSYRISKAQGEQVDLNQDGKVDVFDLCIMRKKLINK